MNDTQKDDGPQTEPREVVHIDIGKLRLSPFKGVRLENLRYRGSWQALVALLLIALAGLAAVWVGL
jgi:hypothetical protein